MPNPKTFPRMHHYDILMTDAEYLRCMADIAATIQTPEHQGHARRLRAIADVIEKSEGDDRGYDR